MTINKIVLSTATLIVLSHSLYADNELGPILLPTPENMKTEILHEVKKSNFYMGLGYAFNTIENGSKDVQASVNTSEFRVGYNINDYLAIEGRFNGSFGSMRTHKRDVPWSTSNLALYVKPKLPIDDTGFTAYAVLGLGKFELDNQSGGIPDNLYQWGQGKVHKETAYQWGFGLQYSINDDFDMFLDYTSLYSSHVFDNITNHDNITARNISIGFIYKF